MTPTNRVIFWLSLGALVALGGMGLINAFRVMFRDLFAAFR